MSNSMPKLSSESFVELNKLIELMDEDAPQLTAAQAISDYIVPILSSMLGEIEANRELIVSTADRASLAILLNEKTFMGEIITAVAEHFVTLMEELSPSIDPESKAGVAMSEIQELLATWMSFNMSDSEESSEEDFEEDDEDVGVEEDADDVVFDEDASEFEQESDEASEETPNV